jgi:hypothetical protein
VSVDPRSGALATSRCPEPVTEAFLAGEAPVEACPLHPEGGSPAPTPRS